MYEQIASPDRGGQNTGRWCSGTEPLQRMYEQIEAPTGATEFLSYLLFVDGSFLQGFRFASPLPVFLTPLSGLCGASSYTILFVIKIFIIQKSKDSRISGLTYRCLHRNSLNPKTTFERFQLADNVRGKCR